MFQGDTGKCTLGYVSWKARFGWKANYDHTNGGYSWKTSHPSGGLWYMEGIDPGLPANPPGDHRLTRTWTCCDKGFVIGGGSALLTQELGSTASVHIDFSPGGTDGCC